MHPPREPTQFKFSSNVTAILFLYMQNLAVIYYFFHYFISIFKKIECHLNFTTFILRYTVNNIRYALVIRYSIANSTHMFITIASGVSYPLTIPRFIPFANVKDTHCAQHVKHLHSSASSKPTCSNLMGRPTDAPGEINDNSIS